MANDLDNKWARPISGLEGLVMPNDAKYEFRQPGPVFKYKEPEILTELMHYISSTYGQHYVDKDNPLGVQMNDIFLSMGTAEAFWKSNAAKYVMRYGRKSGHNRKDLLKAAHYVILLLYHDQLVKKEGQTEE